MMTIQTTVLVLQMQMDMTGYSNPTLQFLENNKFILIIILLKDY